MKIHPYDHILRFRFESDTRPDISHVVDLGAFGGFGECSCEDFCYRVRPAVAARENGNDGNDGNDEIKRCKHILAARECLLNSVIDRVVEGERGLE